MKDYNKAYKKGKKLLEDIARQKGWKYYDIVEDSYTYPYGLLLIGYEDEASMKGMVRDINEIGYVCINLDGCDKLV